MKGLNYMKNKMIKLLLFSALLVSFTYAKSPVRYMTTRSLGIEYTCMWRGQTITEATVPSHEQFWQFALDYAPVEYIQLLFGIGAGRFRVDEVGNTEFKGNYGFSFSGGAYAYSPAFIQKVLRITAGVDIIYLNCEDDYDYKYSGPVFDPLAGLIIYAGPYIEIEAGAKGHFISGRMKEKANKSEDFSNNEPVKGYVNLTAYSPNGVYGTFHFDASKETKADWGKGPYEGSIGFSVGVILTDKRHRKKGKKEKSKYFPEYEEMKKKQEKMLDDIE